MPILHRVREHFRKKDTHVDEYARGRGSRVGRYLGRFGAEATTGFGQISQSAKMKVADKLEKRRKEREAERNIRDAVRQEESAKREEIRKQERLKRIETQEKRRATEGGFFTRSLRSSYGLARKYALNGKSRSRRGAKRMTRRRRFTVREDREAKRIARQYRNEGYSAREAKRIGYATVNLHKRGVRT